MTSPWFVVCPSISKAASLVLSSLLWSLPKILLVSSICAWRPACSVTFQYEQCCKFRGNITMVWSKLKHPQSFLSDVLSTVKEHIFQSWDCIGIKYLLAKIICTFWIWTCQCCTAENTHHDVWQVPALSELPAWLHHHGHLACSAMLRSCWHQISACTDHLSTSKHEYCNTTIRVWDYHDS